MATLADRLISDLLGPAFGRLFLFMCVTFLTSAQTSVKSPVTFTRQVLRADFPVAVAIADFNRDGFPDLVFAEQNVGEIRVLLGLGDGTFQPGDFFDVGFNPESVATGDFNGDGIADFVVGTAVEGLKVYLGTGEGHFARFPTVIQNTWQESPSLAGDACCSVTIADLNGDGISDVIATDFRFGNGTVYVALGKGDGTFKPASKICVGSAPFGLGGAEFDNDGKPDLAVGTSDNVVLLLGKGDGTFKPSANVFFSQPGEPFLQTLLAVGDFDGDGWPDLVVGQQANDSYGSSAVFVLMNNKDQSFRQVLVAVDSGSSMAVADFDGDGNSDVMIVGVKNGAQVYLGNGKGSFKWGWSDQTAIGYYPSVGDLNLDGRPDVVIPSF